MLFLKDWRLSYFNISFNLRLNNANYIVSRIFIDLVLKGLCQDCPAVTIINVFVQMFYRLRLMGRVFMFSPSSNLIHLPMQS